MRSRLICTLAAQLVAAGVAGSAHAAFFSFASDVNSNAFTFGGTAGTAGSFLISDFSRPNTYTLLIDDNNGPLPSIPIAVELHASLTANTGQSISLGGGLFQHTYRVTGTFGFYTAAGQALLTATVGPNAALLTVPGTQTAWSTTGAVLGADSFANVTYTATSALVALMGGTATAAQYGIAAGSSGPASPDDFAFDLTVINNGTVGTGVPIDATTKAPTSAWRSESSFSGSTFIPAPGSLGLLGFGAMAVARRRRSRCA